MAEEQMAALECSLCCQVVRIEGYEEELWSEHDPMRRSSEVVTPLPGSNRNPPSSFLHHGTNESVCSVLSCRRTRYDCNSHLLFPL